MAFTVTLYQFQKRKNSTLQPTALQGVELNCELKQPTSYKNPVFTVFVEAGFEWNYLKWDSWYYFITDVVSVRNNIFEVHYGIQKPQYRRIKGQKAVAKFPIWVPTKNKVGEDKIEIKFWLKNSAWFSESQVEKIEK
mgnify:CR=1 FL=1